MHKVNDLILDASQVKIVFVLESPFKDELIHGHPLAGSSGQAVSDYLRIYSKLSYLNNPIGCEILSREITSIGIVNTSLMPLDKKCYCLVSSDKEKIEALDFIRTNPKPKNRRKQLIKKFEAELFLDFKGRIENITSVNKEVIFVPCGELANKFLSMCDELGISTLSKIPHPSFNNWRGKSFSYLNKALRSYL